MNKLRIVAGALALASVMVLVPSCGGNKDEVKLTNVFRQESVKLPDKYAEADNFNMNELCSSACSSDASLSLPESIRAISCTRASPRT